MKDSLATSNYIYIYKEHVATVQNNGKNKKGKDTKVFLLTIHQKWGEGAQCYIPG